MSMASSILPSSHKFVNLSVSSYGLRRRFGLDSAPLPSSDLSLAFPFHGFGASSLSRGGIRDFGEEVFWDTVFVAAPRGLVSVESRRVTTVRGARELRSIVSALEGEEYSGSKRTCGWGWRWRREHR